MTTNRSAEELAMRDAVETWGRARWPAARVVHELVVGERRIDMAFIAETHLVGVEIKGPRDTLDRLEPQLRAFTAHLPEVWLARDVKWADRALSGVGRFGGIDFEEGRIQGFTRWYRPDPTVTVQMLRLLWRDELDAVAVRHRLVTSRSRATMDVLAARIARMLTGDQIVAEVCRELRARDTGAHGKAFWRADPAVAHDGAAVARSGPASLGLLGAGR